MTNRELIDYIMPDIERYFLQNGRGYIILEGYDYLREIITLYGKQHNLVESTLLLADSGHNEEAYVLARSILNNYFLIGYLLNDEKDRKRLKEYRVQPYISERYYWKNIKKIMNRPTIQDAINNGVKPPFDEGYIKNRIFELGKIIEKEGFNKDKELLSISYLAKNSDRKGLELYSTYYADASKYEHSDISTLEIYKQSVEGIDEFNTNQVFILNLDKTDESIKEKIYNMIIMSYAQTFVRIIEYLNNNEEHLLDNMDKIKLLEISCKILDWSNTED